MSNSDSSNNNKNSLTVNQLIRMAHSKIKSLNGFAVSLESYNLNENEIETGIEKQISDIGDLIDQLVIYFPITRPIITERNMRDIWADCDNEHDDDHWAKMISLFCALKIKTFC